MPTVTCLELKLQLMAEAYNLKNNANVRVRVLPKPEARYVRLLLAGLPGHISFD